MTVAPSVAGAPTHSAPRHPPALVSIVSPAFNEGPNVREFCDTVAACLSARNQPFEIILVNDGSRDDTLAAMFDARSQHPEITIIDLSRNFGKEIAMIAGMDQASGDATVVMDADLQHPPALISTMLAHYQEGYDVVVAVRAERSSESFMRRVASRAFYRLMERSGDVPLPSSAGDYRLLSRKALGAVLSMREHHRFLKGMFAWIGLPTKFVPFSPPPRTRGTSSFSFWRLWNFSLEGVTSHTLAPLKASTYVGVLVACAALIYGTYIVGKTLLYGEPVAGFPTIATLVLFLGGLQLIVLGVIGEYLGRIFNETKNRPLYVVNQVWTQAPERTIRCRDVSNPDLPQSP